MIYYNTLLNQYDRQPLDNTLQTQQSVDNTFLTQQPLNNTLLTYIKNMVVLTHSCERPITFLNPREVKCNNTTVNELQNQQLVSAGLIRSILSTNTTSSYCKLHLLLSFIGEINISVDLDMSQDYFCRCVSVSLAYATHNTLSSFIRH